MKKIFLLFCLILICIPATAQIKGKTKKVERKTAQADVQKKKRAESTQLLGQGAENKIEEVKRNLSTFDTRDRLILEFTHENWANKPDDVSVRWYNRGFNFYFMYDVGLLKNNISIAPGIGFASANVYHKSQIVRADSTGNTVFLPLGDTIDVSRNKLNTNFLDAALELRFRSNPNKVNKTFKLALGVRVGYMLDGHTVYRGDPLDGSDVDEVFIKNKIVPNINRFRYGASVRFGYGNFNIFGFYSFSKLFDGDNGPGINPFSIGVSFNSF